MTDPAHDQAVEVTPRDYTAMFARGVRPPHPITGVCGRVARGRTDADFNMLSFIPGRRLAMVTGPRGMWTLIGQPAAAIVLGIGKKEDWLREKLAEGNRWKLVVMPQASYPLADWDGLFAAIRLHYPEVAGKLLRWAPQLREPSLSAKIAPELVSGRVKDDVSHPQHMTAERYVEAEDTPLNARLFLWHSLGMNDLFKGDGLTVGPDGSPGVDEYLAQNRPISQIPGAVLIDLDVASSLQTG